MEENAESDYELLSADALKPLFCVSPLKPKYKLFRLNTSRARVYYRENPHFANNSEFNVEQRYQMFLGTTSVGALMPMEKVLLYWYAKLGVDAAYEYMRQKAVYGSFYHTIIADITILGQLNLDELPARIMEYAFENKVPHEIAEEWKEEIKMDILCYCQWIIDYNVKVLAVEIPLCSETNGIATLIDMVAWVNDKNYRKMPLEKRKQHLAIIDFKSGKKGFRKQHRLQLVACKEIFNENFPDHQQIQALYNFAPKNFKKQIPSYSFVNQTDKEDPEENDIYINLGKKKLLSVIKRPIRVVEGNIKFGEQPSGFIMQKTIEDVINENHWGKYLQDRPQPEVETIEE